MIRCQVALPFLLIATVAYGQTRHPCVAEDAPPSCAAPLLSVAREFRDEQKFRQQFEAAHRAYQAAQRGPAERANLEAEAEAASLMRGALQGTGELALAEEWSREAVTTALAAYGEQSVEHLLALLGLSHVLGDRGKSAEQAQIVRGALAISDRFDYDLKFIISKSLRNNLAIAQMNLGDRLGADDTLMAIGREILGELGKQHGTVRSDLDDVPAYLARHAMDPKLDDIRGLIFQLAMIEGNIAQNCHEGWEVERCMEFFADAAKLHAALAPQWPKQEADNLVNMAASYRRDGRTDMAEQTLRQALGQFTKALGPQNPGTLGATFALGDLLLRDRHDAAAALVYLRQSRDGLLDELARSGASSEGTERVRTNGNVFRRVVEAAWGVTHSVPSAAPTG